MNTEEKKENLEPLQEEDNIVETNSTSEEESNLGENVGETKEDLADSQEKKIVELNDKVLRLLAENQNIRKNKVLSQEQMSE